MTTSSPDIAVLLFDGHAAPRPLRDLPSVRIEETSAIDDVADCRRLIVVGGDASLAAVLTRLMRTEKLDVEVAFVPPRRSAATRIYRLPCGWRAARRARRASARRVPLIRDDTGVALVGQGGWRGSKGRLFGEAVVDDTRLFDGEVDGVRVEPLDRVPGLRASALTAGGRRVRWVVGRAAQLGCTGAVVTRDGVTATRTVPRSTFYRHTKGWLLVR